MGLFYVFYSVCFYYCHILAGNISGCRSYCSSSLCLHLPDYSWGTSIFAYDNDFDCNGVYFCCKSFLGSIIIVGFVSSCRNRKVFIAKGGCCHRYASLFIRMSLLLYIIIAPMDHVNLQAKQCSTCFVPCNATDL